MDDPFTVAGKGHPLHRVEVGREKRVTLLGHGTSRPW